MKVFKMLIPIHFQAGTVSIRAWCYRPRGIELMLLQNQAYAMEEMGADLAERIAVLGEAAVIRQVLNTPARDSQGRNIPLTLAEVDRRKKHFDTWREVLGDDLPAFARAYRLNKARRVAAMVDSWDLTDGGEPAPITLEVIETFPPRILNMFLQKLESAIPVVSSRDATNN